MPKVGKKHFSYDAAGKKAAKKEAKKTGKKVEYNMGGKVETYQDQVKRKCS
jgi:hypothetical protein|tara:strand:- start:391 stop:543 length:153 start_codon:yes stop_codon:yes gene_type:complete